MEENNMEEAVMELAESSIAAGVKYLSQSLKEKNEKNRLMKTLLDKIQNIIIEHKTDSIHNDELFVGRTKAVIDDYIKLSNKK